MAATYNIQLYQGDNYVLNFTVDQDYSTASGWDHKLTLATALEAPLPTLVLSSPTEITATYDGTVTSVVATFSSAATTALDAETIYVWDYQVENGTTVSTLMAGTVSLIPQVSE